MNIYLLFLILLIVIYLFVKVLQRYYFNRKYNPLLLKRGLVIQGYTQGKTDKKKIHVMTKEEIKNGGYKLSNAPTLNGQKKWTINFWMKPENLTTNFHDANDSQQEHLLEWGQSVYLLYEPLRNELQLMVNVIVDKEKQEHQQFRFPNAVGIQKWNMITVSFDNRNVDLFVNGKLYKSIVLYNVPIFDESNWTVCNFLPFTGKITAIRFFFTNLNEYDVQYIYSQSHPTTPIDSAVWWFWKKSYISF